MPLFSLIRKALNSLLEKKYLNTENTKFLIEEKFFRINKFENQQ